MIYTIVGDQFNQWVQEKIRERNDRVASKHDLMIELDPAIARAFEASTMISSTYTELLSFLICFHFVAANGRAVHLLKPGSKRRRTQVEAASQLNQERAAEYDQESMSRKVQE